MTWEESFAFQVFEGQLLNFMDEALEEWEWRERLKAAGLPLNHWRLVRGLINNETKLWFE